MAVKLLVIYTYFASQVADYNLDKFLSREVRLREDIDYCIVINGYTCNVDLPEHLPNLRVLRRPNIGFDFGGHAAALEELHDTLPSYTYYFFMNSGVCGPFVPHYHTEHWSKAFYRKLVGDVKVVGTTIVCLPPWDPGGFGPKVEGFFFVTDRQGLELLRAEGTIFRDHPDKLSAIVEGEYGVSRCILRHGYTIDCMLHRYQGIDWTDRKNWTLNDNRHPTRLGSYFGDSINPYEVIFHKWFWQGQPPVAYKFVVDYMNTQ